MRPILSEVKLSMQLQTAMQYLIKTEIEINFILWKFIVNDKSLVI